MNPLIRGASCVGVMYKKVDTMAQVPVEAQRKKTGNISSVSIRTAREKSPSSVLARGVTLGVFCGLASLIERQPLFDVLL